MSVAPRPSGIWASPGLVFGATRWPKRWLYCSPTVSVQPGKTRKSARFGPVFTTLSSATPKGGGFRLADNHDKLLKAQPPLEKLGLSSVFRRPVSPQGSGRDHDSRSISPQASDHD